MIAVQRIQFHHQVSFNLSDRTRLKAALARIVTKEGFSIEHINFIFVTDEVLLKMNLQYLRHSTLTDIITFQLNTPRAPLLADIFISVDRVRENAQTYEVSFRHELHRVMFHGMLHLCGYKDKTKPDIKLMRSKEQEYLSYYFVPRGTSSQL